MIWEVDFKVDCNITVSRSQQTGTNMTRKRFFLVAEKGTLRLDDKSVQFVFDTFSLEYGSGNKLLSALKKLEVT